MSITTALKATLTTTLTTAVRLAALAAALLAAASPADGSGAVPAVAVAVAAAPAVAPVPGAPGPPAGAGALPGCAGPRCWPVAGPGPRGRPLVLRTFDPPATPWAAGHRGVDLRAGPGAAVRAAASGEVAFSGPVGGVPVVVVRLPGGLRTTYEPVRGVLPVGTPVEPGRPLGVLAGGLPHCPGPCLHWGLLSAERYLDPLTLLPPALRRSEPSRLLPLPGRPRLEPQGRGT